MGSKDAVQAIQGKIIVELQSSQSDPKIRRQRKHLSLYRLMISDSHIEERMRDSLGDVYSQQRPIKQTSSLMQPGAGDSGVLQQERLSLRREVISSNR